jgi:putative spermidine/putrescine transport system ATP-binding protein
MTRPKLNIRDVSKKYGQTNALLPTSLKVEPGEFLTLLGPSGSGKTTLLLMIAGLTEASGGSIHLDGSDITRLPAYKRDVGVVFQNYALFPHLNVYENVAFPLRLRKKSESEICAAVERTLDLVRLGHLAQRLPRELSGGQQQRVAFARAIVFDPQLILMDEPLGALDKKLRDELKLEIRKLHGELKKTIIYVTHDQEEAMLLSDRVVLMNDAHIEQIAPPVDLYERPATAFAAGFIGESNLVECDVAAGAGVMFAGTRLVTSFEERLPASGKVTVLMRPERIRMDPKGRLQGTVTDVIDLGVTSRLTVAVQNGPDITISVPGGAERLLAGDRVCFDIQPKDVVPLARAGA